MTPDQYPAGALLLYRNQPARLLAPGTKPEILLLEKGEHLRVRPKDIILLHPGPAESVESLEPDPRELDEARELLEGEECTLEELAGLLFNRDDPSAIWSAWRVVGEGLHFQGTPHRFRARSRDDYAAERRKRQERRQRREVWQGFLERVAQKALRPEDDEFLRDLFEVALGRGRECRLLQHLKRQQSRENAHALLLELGRWPLEFNPHPLRLGFNPARPEPFPKSSTGTPGNSDELLRRDLTGLESFAIDDEGSSDPDDAIAFDGERVWIHVADVAAFIPPNSDLDLAARERGATLYLPEATLPMLPETLTRRLGLGLEETSPALSLALKVSSDGIIEDLEIHSARIRVKRLSYREAETKLDSHPALKTLTALAAAHRRRRAAAGAVTITLPECRIRVNNGEISITPLPRYRSRELVSELMLMAGRAVAEHACANNLPMPYAGQLPGGAAADNPPPDSPETDLPAAEDNDFAEMFARRCRMRPGRLSAQPQPHAGLGLDAYIRVTSPLRRYLDLVAHQQLRAHLAGRKPLTEAEIQARIAAVADIGSRIRQTERLSNRHWTLLYLKRHPDWRGDAVVIGRRNRKSQLLLPELALEWEQNLPDNPAPGTAIRLHSPRVNLPWLEILFQSR